MKQTIKQYLEKLLCSALKSLSITDEDAKIQFSARPEIADFQSTVAFSLAKKLHTNQRAKNAGEGDESEKNRFFLERLSLQRRRNVVKLTEVSH